MNKASFDHIAATYDTSFTHTAIGSLQRKACWRYVEKVIPQLKGPDILEINCGTGEDSVMFGKKGFHIVATDISAEMLKVAERKVTRFSMQENIDLKIMDISNFDATIFKKKFDLIFSNFGGLNCIEPGILKNLFDNLAAQLNPGGRLIAVVMPKYCLWESLYFIFKFRFTQAFRRWTNDKIDVNLNDVKISTWYYNPSTIQKWSQKKLKQIDCLPIGLLLPPTYMERFFLNRMKTLKRLSYLDTKLNRFSFLSPLADHYLIDLKLL